MLIGLFGGGVTGQLLALFAATLLHEEVALVAAGYMIVEHKLPLADAAVVIFFGIVAGDWGVYGLGVAARRLPWMHRRLRADAVSRSREWMEQHLVLLVAPARVFPGPGILFPTFLALGSIGISFRRFALATTVAAAIYTPAALLLIVTFGAGVVTRVGQWAWLPFLAAVVMSLAGPWGAALRRRHWAFVDRIRPDFVTSRRREMPTHQGLPILANLRAHASLAEHIPPVLFYVPIVLHWIALGIRYKNLTLPTIANPRIETGGLFGESKVSYLDMVGADQRQWLAPYFALKRGAAGEVDADLEIA